jgi:hypothetical protein
VINKIHYLLSLFLKNFMHRIISAILLTGFISPAFSQTIIRPTGATNGTLPIQLNPATMSNILTDPFRGQGFKISNNMGDVEGTPFLFKEWKNGDVTLKNGEKYKIEKMNLDASRDQFVYTINDSLFEFSDNIREIRIYGDDHKNDPGSDMIFRSDINSMAANFVQVLTMGKITIFCENSKKPEGENYTNGIVTNTRKYVLHSNYYSLVDNKAVPIKFSSSTLDNLTSDKKKQVEVFIKENKLKVKKESDFLKAINFYNSISTTIN